MNVFNTNELTVHLKMGKMVVIYIFISIYISYYYVKKKVKID